MKLYKYLLPLATLGLTACSTDFLSDVETTYITQEQKDQLVADPGSRPRVVKAEMDAIYEVLKTATLNGNTAHDYFGLKSIQLATDLVGEDMVQTAHHWFGFDYNQDNRNADYRRTRLMWQLFYKVIASSNELIDKYLSNESELTEELAALKAELYTLRGMSYFYLVNLYQQTYKGHEQAPGVPLYLSSNSAKKARNTVDEVYQQILADLNYGVEHGLTTDDHQDADARVAAAYLAKAYAAMEDWANVEKFAKIAVDGVSIAMASNYYKVENDDVLWGYSINDQNTDVYATFFSHIDGSIDGYAGAGVYKAIHNKLYEQIPNNDARKAWWNAKEGLINTKFKSLPDFTGDYIYLRSADPYLLYVEALAEQGKKEEASAALKELLVSRGVSTSVDEHQDDLIEFVRLQRRIELWGEGTSFFDLKRWKKGIVRDVEGTNHRTKKDVPVADPKFAYQLPTTEMQRNDLLVQNP